MLFYILLFFVPFCHAMENKLPRPSHAYQSLPSDDDNDPRNQIYPAPLAPSLDEIKVNSLKAVLQERTCHQEGPGDPYSLLFELAPHFEGQKDALEGINGMIKFLHKLDPNTDQRGTQGLNFSERDALVYLAFLAEIKKDDPKVLAKLSQITLNFHRMAPTPMSKSTLVKLRKLIQAHHRRRRVNRSRPEAGEIVELMCWFGPWGWQNNLPVELS